MSSLDSVPCEFCVIGYHAPFERFEKIAAVDDGPTLLMQCKLCGKLWHETLHSVMSVSISEAASLYPEISKKDPM